MSFDTEVTYLGMPAVPAPPLAPRRRSRQLMVGNVPVGGGALRVAVMGCVVNGPGEAREADLGVSSGNGKGQIFVKGKVVATVPESRIVETLVDHAVRLAEQWPGDRLGIPCVAASHAGAQR